MFYQVFFSPQMKRWAIITCKHRISECPHELTNDLRLIGNISKVSKPHRMIARAQSTCQKKALLILVENSSKTEIKLFPLCAISYEN